MWSPLESVLCVPWEVFSCCTEGVSGSSSVYRQNRCWGGTVFISHCLQTQRCNPSWMIKWSLLNCPLSWVSMENPVYFTFGELCKQTNYLKQFDGSFDGLYKSACKAFNIFLVVKYCGKSCCLLLLRLFVFILVLILARIINNYGYFTCCMLGVLLNLNSIQFNLILK